MIYSKLRQRHTINASNSAIKDGFEVQVVVDAGGSPTTLADGTALRRMAQGQSVKHGSNMSFKLPPIAYALIIAHLTFFAIVGGFTIYRFWR